VTDDFVKAAIEASKYKTGTPDIQVLAQATKIREQIRKKFPTTKSSPAQPFVKPRKTSKGKR